MRLTWLFCAGFLVPPARSKSASGVANRTRLPKREDVTASKQRIYKSRAHFVAQPGGGSGCRRKPTDGGWAWRNGNYYVPGVISRVFQLFSDPLHAINLPYYMLPQNDFFIPKLVV